MQQRSMPTSAVTHLTVGGIDWRGGDQLRRHERIVDGHYPGLQVAAPTGTGQRARIAVLVSCRPAAGVGTNVSTARASDPAS